MFLHADTIVPEKFDLAINKCLQKPGNVAGAFKFSLDILEIPEILRLVIDTCNWNSISALKLM